MPACGYQVYDLVRRIDRRRRGDGRRSAYLENDHLRVELDDQGLLSSIFDKAAGRQVLAPENGATASNSTPTTPTSTTPGTSTGSPSTRSIDLDDVESIEVVEQGPLRAGIRVSPPVRSTPASPRSSGWTAGSPLHRLRHRGGVARDEPTPQGGVPGRRAEPPGHLRDPVRPRGTADPRQHQLGRGPLRGLRPQVGRPVRTRVRRGPAQRLQVRLRHRRQRHAPVAPPGPDVARSGGRPGPPPLHLPSAPPPRRSAASRGHRRRLRPQRASADGDHDSPPGPRGPRLPGLGRCPPCRRRSGQAGRRRPDALVVRLYEAWGRRDRSP